MRHTSDVRVTVRPARCSHRPSLWKASNADHHRLPINEVYWTIQGEGVHTGVPALFVRMQGCAVGCPWCDTKHTWKFNESRKQAPNLPRFLF